MQKTRFWPIVGACTLIAPLTLVLPADGAQRQAVIHERGAMVMPFSLSDTRHVFRTTADGGLQEVVVKDGSDVENIALIRKHLHEIAGEFAAGNFSDPKTLHGDAMPGVAVLEREHDALNVTYAELPNGAQIMYTSTDPEVIAAIHEWFQAQLRDHGPDATDIPGASACDHIPEGHDPEMWRLHHGCE